MKSVKDIHLTVPNDFILHSWFADAKPEEVAVVLEFASSLPRILGDEKDVMSTKLYAARTDGTNSTIRKVLEEATQRAETKLQGDLLHLTKRLETASCERDTLQETTKQHEVLIRTLEADVQELHKTHIVDKKNLEMKLQEEKNEVKHHYERQMAEKEHILQMELAKMKTYETHLSDTATFKIEAAKRDITMNITKQHEQMKDELTRTRATYEQLQEELEQKVRAARQDEKRKADEQHVHVCEELRAAKAEADSKLFEAMTQKCQLNEDHLNGTTVLKDRIATLNEKIVELQNPMGRGNAGEYDIAQTLRDIGYHVEDTSDGDRKDAGYLDLLVRTDCAHTDNMRIAVEVKNKKTIKKASDEKVKRKDKDIDDDVNTFKQRAKDGILNGLFDAAMFVSIRAHTKMGAPVVLEMYEDSTNRPLAPVSYLGPEKGKGALPLTQEQLETQMYMMFCILDQCHNIRRELCNGLKDEEVGAFQSLFEEMGSFLNRTFTDLRKQEQLIQDMNVNLTTIRCKCIKMFRSIYQVNSKTPWLQRKIDAEWVSVYESARHRAETMKDSDVWNAVSKQKATIENTIGKEAMLQSIRTEQHEEDTSHLSKKAKT